MNIGTAEQCRHIRWTLEQLNNADIFDEHWDSWTMQTYSII